MSLNLNASQPQQQVVVIGQQKQQEQQQQHHKHLPLRADSNPSIMAGNSNNNNNNNLRLSKTSSPSNAPMQPSNYIARLTRLLDLRFADPKLEHLYHSYYAQVKRNLLPTAIQVVLLVNLLQMLATCLNYYLLVDGRAQLPKTPRRQPLASDTTATSSSRDASRSFEHHGNRQQQQTDLYAQTLVWPLLIQLIVFVITFAMFRVVRAECSPTSSSSGDQAALAATRASRRRHRRRRRRNSNSLKSSSSSSSSQDDDELDDDASSSNDEDDKQIALRNLKNSSTDDNGAARSRRRSSSGSDDDDDDAADEAITLKTRQLKYVDDSDEKLHHATTSGGGNDKLQPTTNATNITSVRTTTTTTSNNKRRARHLPRSTSANNLPRYKLSLPYVLWTCQLAQLASGLWPQQSFISYSTLLLYSYAIYVIFPIRLHSCIALALGLSLFEPLMDHVLLVHLSESVYFSQTSSNNNTHRLAANGDVDNDFRLTTTTTNEERTNKSGQSASYMHSTHFDQQHKLLTDGSLAIPMTSQLSKLWAFMLLALGVNVIGIMSFFFYERQQRAAFLETRQSLETKLILEQESREQERLLLSILPKHLAAEIRQDLGAVFGGQFKKIYMARHENVSILFADIVGFTAISSDCPAPKLVGILNELFARFDKLAEKYHQLRIKILGDCYYAISGAPKERPDHAVLCVHMGLSMVEAIKSVRERTKSTVDMRVGVHTGGVLAGVLGQRQWQFDVYSKDVELANKMESSGLPGRVHISHATLRFLNDEFELSEGDGASREEALRLANIKTYFIDRVKKPYPEGTLDAPQVGGGGGLQRSGYADGDGDVLEPTTETNIRQVAISSKKEREKLHSSTTGRKKGVPPMHQSNNSQQQQQQQLLQEPARQKQRNDSFNFDNQIKPISLNFNNREFEKQFRSTSDITSCISLVGLPITLLCAFGAYVYLYKLSLELALFYSFDSFVLIFAVLVCVAPYLWLTNGKLAADAANQHDQHGQCNYSALQRVLVVSNKIGQSAWMKLVLSACMTCAWLSAHLVACYQAVRLFDTNFQQTSTGGIDEEKASLQSKIINIFSVDLLNYFAITCALAITAITRISFLMKTFIIIVVLVQQVILNKTILSTILVMRSSVWNYDLIQQQQTDYNHKLSNNQTTTNSFVITHLGADDYDQFIFSLTLLTICWTLLLMNRQFELTNRRLFLWRKQVEDRKEKVADMRRKNEALVYNILPPNVAKIFLGKRQLKDEELYSKSYDAVGVLFAAMPNFSNFYSEESVNNQGLECLRFLNEVISDYDALLDKERFKNIVKIKTMGSTYMAASGLYEGDAAAAIGDGNNQNGVSRTNGGETFQEQNGGDEEIVKKWAHLEQLTEFALALKDTLNSINKESFNNFVLRIGINQGPITAGVIGVKKPHFDMWGNTVNVASRMESTGRAGSIQVVEETALILQHFGFQFEQRGLILVKGKGKLMTHYLTGRTQNNVLPSSSSSSAAANQKDSSSLSWSQQRDAPVKETLGSSSSPPLVAPTPNQTNSSALANNDSGAATISSKKHSTSSQDSLPHPADTTGTRNNRRMFITPARRDFNTDADIHLV